MTSRWLALVALSALMAVAAGQEPLMSGTLELKPDNNTFAIPLPVGLDGWRVSINVQDLNEGTIVSGAMPNDEAEVFYAGDADGDSLVSMAEQGSVCDSQPRCDFTFMAGEDKSAPLSYVFTTRGLPTDAARNVSWQVFAANGAQANSQATLSSVELDNGARELTTTLTPSGDESPTVNTLVLDADATSVVVPGPAPALPEETETPTPTTPEPSPPTPTTPPSTTQEGCAVKLCMAMDMGTETKGRNAAALNKEWTKQQQLYENVVNTFGADSWFSSVAYNDAAYAVNYATTNKTEAIEMVNNASPTPGGSNYASPLLLCAQNLLAVPRFDIPAIVVLLSDSEPTAPEAFPGPDASAMATAASLKDTYGMTIMTVGWADAGNALLQAISSPSQFNDGLPLTFRANGPNQLPNMAEPLASAACSVPTNEPYNGQVPEVEEMPNTDSIDGSTTTIINNTTIYNYTSIVQTITSTIENYNSTSTNITYVSSDYVSDIAQTPLPTPAMAPSPAMASPAMAVFPSPAMAPSPLMAAVFPSPALAPSPAFAFAPSPMILPSPSPNFPSPSPMPMPQCESEPMCRLYLEDMVCCEEQGIVGNKTFAQAWVVCNERVWIPPQCLMVDGPENATTSFVFQGPSFGEDQQMPREYEYAFEYFVNWSETDPEYEGPVTLALAAGASEDPECRLPLQNPCWMGLTPVPEVKQVQPITFNAVTAPEYRRFSFLPWTDNRTYTLLDSFVFADLDEPEFCQMQVLGELPDDFFAEGWATYNDGFSLMCTNATIPSPKPVQAPVAAPSPAPAKAASPAPAKAASPAPPKAATPAPAKTASPAPAKAASPLPRFNNRK